MGEGAATLRNPSDGLQRREEWASVSARRGPRSLRRGAQVGEGLLLHLARRAIQRGGRASPHPRSDRISRWLDREGSGDKEKPPNREGRIEDRGGHRCKTLR